jgi:diaminopimelate epimerase
MKFYKYHALGNDYIVLDPADGIGTLTPEHIRLICHRNFGVGSDGILLGPLPTRDSDFALQIFNPDGGEAEKSGNGLRIFSRYLWDKGLVGVEPFSVWTKGGIVRVLIHPGGHLINVEMGRVSFASTQIPVAGLPRDVLNESIHVLDREFTFCAATVGNPHCVLICKEISKDMALKYGPLIERDTRFPNRTNVQFLQVLDRSHIRIEIWERGAGYTLASGSSSSAAAAVARKLGLCDADITVLMPGGEIGIRIGEGFEISMTGPVTRVAEGVMAEEVLSQKVKLLIEE